MKYCNLDRKVKTEQRRIEGMMSKELKAEIERLRPPLVKAVIDSHPDVQTARQAHTALSGQLKQAQTESWPHSFEQRPEYFKWDLC